MTLLNLTDRTRVCSWHQNMESRGGQIKEITTISIRTLSHNISAFSFLRLIFEQNFNVKLLTDKDSSIFYCLYFIVSLLSRRLRCVKKKSKIIWPDFCNICIDHLYSKIMIRNKLLFISNNRLLTQYLNKQCSSCIMI